jgi:hypothetical protein
MLALFHLHRMNVRETVKGLWNNAKDLVKGPFSDFNQKSINLNSSSYRGGSGLYFFTDDGKAVSIDFNSLNSSLKAYLGCPPVAAVINKKAQAYINGKTWILNTQGKAKGKEATGDIANRVNALMQRPNALQSWKQFEAQNYIYQQMSGYCVVLPVGKPIGFPNYEAKRLWNVPPWMIQVIEKPGVNLLAAKSIRDFVESVTMTWGGLTVPLPLDEIFIFKDFTPSANSFAFPESRLTALNQPVNNIIGAYESRNVLINRRGALGILSNNAKDGIGQIPIDPIEKQAMEDDFKAYGLLKLQKSVIVTNATVQWQQMGFPTKDLMLFEEIEDDIMRICDAYGFPFPLLSQNNRSSLGSGNEVKTFGRDLYQNTIIPEADLLYEQWNEFFDLERNGLVLCKDFKHVSALQEDQVNEATARWKRNQALQIEFFMNMKTLNQWCEANNEDPVQGDLGELYYYQLLEKGIQFGPMKTAPQIADGTGDGNNQNSSDGK